MNAPPAISHELSVSEMRAETRTHLFLVATLQTGTAAAAVHIRNLSATGALIEGSTLPAVGAQVSIRRASLSIDGICAWRSQTQAGISFRSKIFVTAWLPRQSNSRQCSIDRLVFDSKNSAAVRPEFPSADNARTDLGSTIADLNSLRNDLLNLGESLVTDIILVATHPEIQLLDIAVQKIDRLLASLSKAGSSAISQTSEHSLIPQMS